MFYIDSYWSLCISMNYVLIFYFFTLCYFTLNFVRSCVCRLFLQRIKWMNKRSCIRRTLVSLINTRLLGMNRSLWWNASTARQMKTWCGSDWPWMAPCYTHFCPSVCLSCRHHFSKIFANRLHISITLSFFHLPVTLPSFPDLVRSSTPLPRRNSRTKSMNHL